MALDAARPLPPHTVASLRDKLALEWTYHSNAIEGNSLTPGETRTLIMEDLTAGGKKRRDATDIVGHDTVVKSLPSFITSKAPLSEAEIRQMQAVMLPEPYDLDAVTPEGRVVTYRVRLGEYRREPKRDRHGTGEMNR